MDGKIIKVQPPSFPPPIFLPPSFCQLLQIGWQEDGGRKIRREGMVRGMWSVLHVE
jgi:hypothetical protein